MNEIWKPIVGYEGLYEVSDFGNIKSLYKRYKDVIILKPIILRHGYLGVNLYKNRKLYHKPIHTAVLESFVSLRPFKYQCNHKNGIKSDNRLNNLEWVTPSENTKHSYQQLHIGCQRGSKNNNSKINESDVIEIKKLLNKGVTQYKIGLLYGLCQSQISQIKRNKVWSHIE